MSRHTTQPVWSAVASTGSQALDAAPLLEMYSKRAEGGAEDFVRALSKVPTESILPWDLSADLSTLDNGDKAASGSWYLACEWLATVMKSTAPTVSIKYELSSESQDSSVSTLMSGLALLPRYRSFKTSPPGHKNGWDSLVDPWIDFFPAHGDKVPSAYRVWQSSRRYLTRGDVERARRAEHLNYLLHNSYIPAELDLEGEVTFAYGGIGLIIHKDAHIHPGVTIGANSTIGGNGGKMRIDSRTGLRSTVPEIGRLAVLGACVNVSGGIEVGPLAILAPNSVVIRSVPPGAIMAGVPARQIGQVTAENAIRYKAKYLPARAMSDEEFMELVRGLLPQNEDESQRSISEKWRPQAYAK